ncbi:MAG: hypothetical protein FWC19_05785 [Treponema sp.]|nr:hypothetical protein [Treponema sp.]MCL2272299.1 hypothetical protein [Treponema sp.]
MTFTETLAALVIMGLFLFGFSQAFLPAYQAWDRAKNIYQTAHAIDFIAKSFKAECAKPDRDINNWEIAVSSAKELEYYEITEYWQEGFLRVLKASCVISGERIVIFGLCTP